MNAARILTGARVVAAAGTGVAAGIAAHREVRSDGLPTMEYFHTGGGAPTAPLALAGIGGSLAPSSTLMRLTIQGAPAPWLGAFVGISTAAAGGAAIGAAVGALAGHIAGER